MRERDAEIGRPAARVGAESGLACALCRRSDWRVLHQIGQWRVLLCRNCGTGALHPRPVVEDEGVLYDGYHEETNPLEADELRARGSARPDLLRAVLRFRKGGRFLDVGCGRGEMLKAARAAGFQVEGLEPSGHAAAAAEAATGCTVHRGSLEAASFQEGSFEVVLLSQVLEHLWDPSAALRRVSQWLRPGGILAVRVPILDSYDARSLGEAWKGWSIPYHLWFFTRDGVRSLVEGAGFRILTSFGRPSTAMRKRMRRHPLLRPFRNAIARFYLGSNFTLVACKEQRGEVPAAVGSPRAEELER